MLLITCPYCGPRALAEFAFERPAESIAPLDATPEAAAQRLYTRENPRGRSSELWRHAYGCRAWLRVERDTATHEIAATTLWSEAR
jgi:heterotetrameric sarcosine oxidase delta subunit